MPQRYFFLLYLSFIGGVLHIKDVFGHHQFPQQLDGSCRKVDRVSFRVIYNRCRRGSLEHPIFANSSIRHFCHHHNSWTFGWGDINKKKTYNHTPLSVQASINRFLKQMINFLRNFCFESSMERTVLEDLATTGPLSLKCDSVF